MTINEFYQALIQADTVSQVEDSLNAFEGTHSKEIQLVPVGNRENNRGVIEVSADPGRSIVERLTNAIDAILEAEFIRHDGIPPCHSPKEAGTAWLGVPSGGLSEMTPAQRREIAQRVTVKVLPGTSKSLRTIEVRDIGIGLTAEQMPNTILSLNESNKMQKHYLAGAYGQGGSSTFASSKYTLIASRYNDSSTVSFTIAFYQDLPAEQFKIGRYVYLTLNGAMLITDEVSLKDFSSGTLVKHFGYDLTNYAGSLGPGSVYGLLNQILFDPVMPVWFDNRVHNYRRVIKGTRNALNGAVDEGDTETANSKLSHNVKLFYTTLGEFGQIGIEYWVLEPPTATNKRPSASFVNPAKPIILTLNGQNQAEISQLLIRKEVELPYLSQRLICHIDCNSLTPTAKRELFVSNREDARKGVVYNLIHQEIIKALKSDDELTRLNSEARDLVRRERDQTVLEQTRKEVARLLRLQGIPVGLEQLGQTIGEGVGVDSPQRPPSPPRPPRPKPTPLELHEPPTFIRIVWDENEEITFYPEQRKYIRIETDATSHYHNPNNPSASRINIFALNSGVAFRGSTPLEGGRLRGIFEGLSSSNIGDEGIIRVELTRPGLPVIFDERTYRIVEPPPIKSSSQKVTLPPFVMEPIDGPEDPNWTILGWSDNTNIIASSAEMNDGTLTIYYSTVFPRYIEQRTAFERRGDLLSAESFTSRYEIWLAVHSLIYYQQQQEQSIEIDENNEELVTSFEQQERARFATLAAMFAAREIQIPASLDD